MKICSTHAAGAAALLASLLAGTVSAQMPASAPATAITGSASAAAGAAMARADQGFMKDAAQGGIAEVEAGKLALTKATNPQVKAFAQQMVDDHGKANQELMSLAAGKGVKLPAEPSVAQKAKAKMLSAADGAAFDRKYVDNMLSDHRDTVAMFKKASGSVRDADVKAFVDKTLPTLQHHLGMVQSLQSALKGQAAAKP